ncbi:MAG TPA: cytochrome b/b6 domain-containing protein [Rubrivivax sp.]|nr:cytochrome b/b6 domain-containing protein [Burkholderiales bacterium]HNT39575.1 cytochrome b/b6 domain-containing protein [Rubrivivax sp.]
MKHSPRPADDTRVRVWDLPTRAFHWLLALALVAQVATGKVGGGAMVWHFRIGYFIFALLLFRLAWGFVGGHWSRFAHFVPAPATLLRYLRGQSRSEEHHDVGHSPLGALSVLAMLLLLAAQVAAGLVADDEIANVGPLNRFVSGATAAWATGWHKGPGIALLMATVLLHVGAIAYYRLFRKRSLVLPMITGDKTLPAADVPAARDSLGTRLLALALMAASGALVAWVVRLGG